MVKQRCIEEKLLLDLESLAYVGKIKNVSLHSCGKRKKYVVVETDEGQKLCSPCVEEEVANQSVKMVELYLKNVVLAPKR